MKKTMGKDKKGKKKSKSKKDVVTELPPTLFSTITPAIAEIQPFDIKDEREYLKEILKLENYNDVRIQLIHFGNLFPTTSITRKDNKTDYKFIEEKYKGPKYSITIDLILLKYTDIKILKYILRLFLNQYNLTIEDFYNKFLINPDEFVSIDAS